MYGNPLINSRSSLNPDAVKSWLFFLPDELKDTFDIDKPKIIFCQSEKVQDVQKALGLLQLDVQIISFDKSADTLRFPDMMEKYGEHIEVEDFK